MKQSYKHKARRILAGLYFLVVISMCSYEKVTIEKGVDEHSELLLSSFIRKADNMFYTLELYVDALANEPKVPQCMLSCKPGSRASLSEKDRLMKRELTPILDKYFDLTSSLEDGFVKYIHFSLSSSKGEARSYLYDGIGWEEKQLTFDSDKEVGLIKVRNSENIFVKRPVYLKGQYLGTVSFISGNYLVNNLEPLFLLRKGFLEAKYYVNDNPWYKEGNGQDTTYDISDHVSASMSYAGLNLEIDVAYSYLSKYQSLFISLFIVSASFILLLLLLENRFNGIEVDKKSKEIGSLKQQREINLLSHHLSNKDKNEKKLQYRATHDLLTGVLNKAAILDRLDKEVLDARRYERDFAILFIDLDDFKHLNDYAGHLAGDYALKLLAENLIGSVRSTDAIGRYGGDEFLIIASSIHDRGSVTFLVDRIKKSLAKLVHYDDKKILLNGSIGIALFPQDASNAKALIEKADTAMYHAKSVGKGAAKFYNPDMDLRAKRELKVESRLKLAIQNKELRLEFQPIIDLELNKAIAAESLLRWNDEELGMVKPDEFIPVAEKCGVINEVGRFVVRESIAQAKIWGQLGDLKVSVNFSGFQFNSPRETLAEVQAALQEANFPASKLQIEVTESLMFNNSQEVLDVLNELVDMDVRLCVDDFGAGYSALNYIHQYPFSVIKIDKDIVMDIGNSKSSRGLVVAILSMAKVLELDVVAEGVEDQDTLNFLKEHGCRYAQGFLFSKALSTRDLIRYLSSSQASMDSDAKPESAECID